mgnify:CR=1 FL=1
MIKVYVSSDSVKESVNYFERRCFNSGEQIGLFFWFKAMGYSNREYHNRQEDRANKEKADRMLYYLSGLFDYKSEKAGKRNSLFPFSIIDGIKGASYYNGGTEFSRLLGRVRDTMDNTLVDRGKYLQKDDTEPEQFKFAPDYLEIILSNFPEGEKISLQKLAAWYFRFRGVEVDDSWNDTHTTSKYEDFTRICKKKIKEELRLSQDELATLFTDDRDVIRFSENPITGNELREMLTFEPNQNPEVNILRGDSQSGLDEQDIDIEYDEFLNLVTPHGENITSEELTDMLQNSKQAILAGPPGTGKSFISDEIASGYDETYKVQFHPNLTYEQFIGGYTFNEEGNVIPKAGTFLEFCEAAKYNPEKKYLFIIDEINRGNLSKIFGETILTLDRGYTVKLPMPLKTMSGNIVDEFSIPMNLSILATMNSADRSIALVDYAIRRRFAFIKFYPNSEIVSTMSDYSEFDDIKIDKLMDSINNKLFDVLGDEDLLLGQSYFLPNWALDTVTKKIKWSATLLQQLFNYYVLPIIEEYTYGNKRYLTNVVGDKLVQRMSDTDEFVAELKLQFEV